MINVVVSKKGTSIKEITITGHANSAPYGEDLVCATVSGIGVGILNAIDQISPNHAKLQMDDGYIFIKATNENETLQTILKTLVVQLETIQYTQSDYIKIKQQEV